MAVGFPEHKNLVTTNLHVACYTVADAAARVTLEAALVSAQVGLFVYQEDTDHIYVCSAAATLVDLGTTVTLEDHDHSGDAGDGGQLEADDALILTGGTTGHYLRVQADDSIDEEDLEDHDHSGDAGDGGQLEADDALLSTDIPQGRVPTADGADAVTWQPVSYDIVVFDNEVVCFDNEVVTFH